MININNYQDEIVKVNVLGEFVQIPTNPYEGSYEVTPSDSEQTLQTTNKQLTQNVVIHKIPSNYGKIAWNGSTLSIT